jgi:ATP-dependent DNA helicase RecG
MARYDSEVVPGAVHGELDDSLLRAFLTRVREQRAVFDGRSDDEILRLLNVVRETGLGLQPTLAGLLAFGRYPQQFFPQLNVTVTVFPTVDPAGPGVRGERFLDNRSIDGSIPTVAQSAIALLKRNMKQRGTGVGLYRIDEWEYPEEVSVRC